MIKFNKLFCKTNYYINYDDVMLYFKALANKFTKLLNDKLIEIENNVKQIDYTGN